MSPNALEKAGEELLKSVPLLAGESKSIYCIMVTESIDKQIRDVLERHNAIRLALLFGSLAKGHCSL